MANSPTLCQRFVAQTIDLIRLKYPDVYIIHYMDDLLIAASYPTQTQETAQKIVLALQQRGFHIAPEKIQTVYPFLFLSFQLDPDFYIPQNFKLEEIN